MTRKQKIIVASSLVAACVAVVVMRAAWQGTTALTRGDRAAEAGDLPEAIRHWRRAARWYVPLAPHVSAAYSRLEETATAAEAAGDKAIALAAWRGVRSSVMATRSFYTPHADKRARANQRIAVLMASIEDPSLDPEKSEGERASWHLKLLERPQGPSVGFSLLALLGFFMWIGGAFWFAHSGVSESDRLVSRVAVRAGALVLIGLLVWLTGLHYA